MWRNNCRKGERIEPKQIQYSNGDVTGDRTKDRWGKKQYFIGTWNVKFMNQGRFISVQFSRSVLSDSLWPHESQHARPPCLSPTPGVHWNSRPSSRWCHPSISSSVVPFSSCSPIPPSIRVFYNESALCMRWPKYWSFIPSKEHTGLISFRMDWLDLLAV